MRRHVLEQYYQKHLGQQYGSSFGRSYESAYDADHRTDRDTEARWSRKADWNNDVNQNTTSDYLLRHGETSDFYGRGPKNYKRRDEDIYEDVCEALWLAPVIDASQMEVSVADGVVTLTGEVITRSARRVTENIVDTITGVRDVINDLRIKKE